MSSDSFPEKAFLQLTVIVLIVLDVHLGLLGLAGPPGSLVLVRSWKESPQPILLHALQLTLTGSPRARLNGDSLRMFTSLIVHSLSLKFILHHYFREWDLPLLSSSEIS